MQQKKMTGSTFRMTKKTLENMLTEKSIVRAVKGVMRAGGGLKFDKKLKAIKITAN